MENVNKNKQVVKIVNEPDLDYQIKIYSRNVKIVDDSWDFRNSNTKEFTHCFHSYPAMMIPQVARRIIDNLGNKSKILFDPYCGTGTSLVEANLKGIDAIGTDLNPLARLIATAKTTKIDIQQLDLFINKYKDYIFSIDFDIGKIYLEIIPDIKNIDYWFSKVTQQKLSLILKFIDDISEISIKNFFKVAFSETVRESSYIKSGEFKLVRCKNYLDKSEPDVFRIMLSRLLRNRIGLVEFVECCKNNAKTLVYDFNTINEIPNAILPTEIVDIVVTSPPYGDSRTTVAYGQYSRLANEWLGFKDANKIDRILMGGEKKKHIPVFKSEILNDVIHTIKKKDKERALDVISFYEDYEKSIKNVSSTVKKGGFACYVVGNRTVKGVTIPNDEITAQLFEENNFCHIETIVRNIPNKRMPLKNSPSNVVGRTASTMKNEYIVIMSKN